MSFGDFIVYADESGDHGLASINAESPVFVLAFCIFKKSDYSTLAVPGVQQLKFRFWGHDDIILHGHDIRKQHGNFNILLNPHTRAAFIEELSGLIEAIPFTLIAAVIDKSRLVKQYAHPANPYEMALTFCMERLHHWLKGAGQTEKLTHVIVERRGRMEDQLLELEFRRITDGRNAAGKMPNLSIRFMDKKHNSTGLQIADLVAHPIGRQVIKPEQPNRAYRIIEKKFRRSPAGKIEGYGLKIFP